MLVTEQPRERPAHVVQVPKNMRVEIHADGPECPECRPHHIGVTHNESVGDCLDEYVFHLSGINSHARKSSKIFISRFMVG